MYGRSAVGAKTAPSKVHKQGQLTKQGGTKGGWKTWKKRWFVLDSEAISYYKSEKDYLDNSSALGSIDVNEVKARVSGSKGFVLETSEFTMHVKSPSPDQNLAWVRAIESVRSANDRTIGKHLLNMPATYSTAPRRSDVLMSEIAEDVSWEERQKSNPSKGFINSGNLKIVSEDLSKWDSVLPNLDLEDETMLNKAATVAQLLDRLTNVSIVDQDFQTALILFHKCFMDSDTLLGCLTDMFSIPVSKYADRRVCTTLRLHILRVLNEWTQLYLHDFSKDMRQKLEEFLTKAERSSQKDDDLTTELEAVLDNIRDSPRSSFRTQDSITFDEDSSILSFSVDAVAHALTNVEEAMLTKIKAREFVGRAWSKENAQKNAPGIVAMVDRFNKVSYWVSTSILKEDEPANRQRLIRRFIRIADCCLQLHNFFGAFEIVIGLSLTPVFRLKSDWNALPARSKSMYTNVTAVINSNDNYIAYRRAFRDGSGKPQVPHLAVTLRDCFQLDCLDTKIGDGKINWIKYEKQWTQIAQILHCTDVDYHTPSECEISALIEHQIKSNLDEDKLYEKSFILQPRGAG